MSLVLAILASFFVVKMCTAKPVEVPNFHRLEMKTSTEHFEQQFRKFIECMRGQLSAGDPEAGIPSFDPWIASAVIPVVTDRDYLILDLQLQNVIVDGLMDFDILSLTLSPTFELEMSFLIDKVQLSALYSGSANLLGMINLYGEGNMDFELSSVKLTTKVQFGLTPPLVTDYSTGIQVGEGNMKITGIFGDEEMSEYLSGEFSKYLVPFLNEASDEISNVISPFFKDYVNKHIGHFTFLEFLGIISTITCDTKIWDIIGQMS